MAMATTTNRISTTKMEGQDTYPALQEVGCQAATKTLLTSMEKDENLNIQAGTVTKTLNTKQNQGMQMENLAPQDQQPATMILLTMAQNQGTETKTKTFEDQAVYLQCQ